MEAAEEIQSLKGEFEDLREDVKAIKDALLGTDFNNKKGFVATVESHEKRIKDLEDKLNNTKWLLIGMSMVAGASAASFLQKIVTVIFHQ